LNAPAPAYDTQSITLSGTGTPVASFTLTDSGPVTVTVGSNGTSALTVTPSGGFTGQVNFACAVSGSPAGLTCSAHRPTSQIHRQ